MNQRSRDFLDGMAAMWLWMQNTGMPRAVRDANWNAIADAVTEDAAERELIEEAVSERVKARR